MLGAKKKADGTAVGAPAQASDRSWGLGRAKRRPSEITAGAASSAVAASEEPPKPTELGMPPKPVAAAASAGKSDLTGSQSMSMRQPGGRRASRSMEDVEAIMALQESIAAEKKERVSMPDSFDDGGDGEKKNSRASHADPKVAAAKAATARFKLNTPPRAAVEVTGIYTDRTYGAKGRPYSDGNTPLTRVKGGKKTGERDPNQTNVADERGRIKWKDDEIRAKNKELIEATPPPPVPVPDRPNFSGHWICTGTTGEWDEYLYMLQVPEFQRKIAKSRQYGKGHAEQLITMKNNKNSMSVSNFSPKLSFTVSDIAAAESDPVAAKTETKPSSVVDLEIDGTAQQLKFGEVQGTGTLSWEGAAIVARWKGPEGYDCYMSRTLLEDSTVGPTMTVSMHVNHVKAVRHFKLKEEWVY